MRNDMAFPTLIWQLLALTRVVAAAALGAMTAAWAVPPPTVRPDVSIELTPNGPEHRVQDTVRAYQPVSVRFDARAGDRLLLSLKDAERVLVLQLVAPSGLLWIDGMVPGPDGIEIWCAQTGVVHLLVRMSADAARSGSAASFELGLRLRR